MQTALCGRIREESARSEYTQAGMTGDHVDPAGAVCGGKERMEARSPRTDRIMVYMSDTESRVGQQGHTASSGLIAQG